MSNKGSDFFETDKEIEIRLAREKKEKEIGELGEPIKISSKVLSMKLVQNEDPTYAYVTESGFFIRKINLKIGKTVKIFKGHSGPVTCVDIIYDSDGNDKYILSGSWDKTIRKWDVASKKEICEYTNHADFIKCIAYEPITNTFLSGSSDRTIRQFNVDTGEQVKLIKGHTRAIEDICFEDYTYEIFYSCSSDTTIKKWNLKTGECLNTFEGHLTSVYKILCDINECSLWSVSADKTLRRWDLDTMKNDFTMEQSDFVKTLIKVGGNIITGSRDSKIRVYEITTGKLIKVIDYHFDEVTSLFNIGSILYSGSLDGTIKKCDLLDDNQKFVHIEKYIEKQVNNIPSKESKPLKKKGIVEENTDDLLTAEELAELEELMSDDD